MSEPESRSIYDMSVEQVEERLLEIERNKIEFFDEAETASTSLPEMGVSSTVTKLWQRCSAAGPLTALNLDLNKDLWANPEDRPCFSP